MLRTDGNFKRALDRKLNKYLTQLSEGHYSLGQTKDELSRIIIAAMRDEPEVYYMIGEGDAITGDNGTHLADD